MAQIKTASGSKFSESDVTRVLDGIRNLKVLAIGDTIIDEYVFAELKGRAVKDPILSVEYRRSEAYCGGILAIANHISNYASKVSVVTLLGDHDSRHDFIKGCLGKNVSLKAFTKADSPTTVKKRYLDCYRNNKLFKIEYINDKPLSQEASLRITEYLKEELGKYDIVVVGDFGHGFINAQIREAITEKSRFLAINVQSNSANMGYNYASQYSKADFLVMNEEETRLPLGMRFDDLNKVLAKFSGAYGFRKVLVTLGKRGCVYFNDGSVYSSPAYVEKVVDTVGAGDAVLAICSLFVYAKAEDAMIPFIANCAGGIKSDYFGNKETITRDKLIDFVRKANSKN